MLVQAYQGEARILSSGPTATFVYVVIACVVSWPFALLYVGLSLWDAARWLWR